MKKFGWCVFLFLILSTQIHAQQIPTGEPGWFYMPDNELYIYSTAAGESFDLAFVTVLQEMGHKLYDLANKDSDSIGGVAIKTISMTTDSSHWSDETRISRAKIGSITIQGLEELKEEESNELYSSNYSNYSKIFYSDSEGGTLMVDLILEASIDERGTVSGREIQIVSDGPSLSDLIRYIESKDDLELQHTVRLDQNGSDYTVYMRFGINTEFAQQIMSDLRR